MIKSVTNFFFDRSRVDGDDIEDRTVTSAQAFFTTETEIYKGDEEAFSGAPSYDNGNAVFVESDQTGDILALSRKVWNANNKSTNLTDDALDNENSDSNEDNESSLLLNISENRITTSAFSDQSRLNGQRERLSTFIFLFGKVWIILTQACFANFCFISCIIPANDYAFVAAYQDNANTYHRVFYILSVLSLLGAAEKMFQCLTDKRPEFKCQKKSNVVDKYFIRKFCSVFDACCYSTSFICTLLMSTLVSFALVIDLILSD